MSDMTNSKSDAPGNTNIPGIDYNHLRAHSHFIDDEEIRFFYSFWGAMWIQQPYAHQYNVLVESRAGGEHPLPTYKWFRGRWDDELSRGWLRYQELKNSDPIG